MNKLRKTEIFPAVALATTLSALPGCGSDCRAFEEENFEQCSVVAACPEPGLPSWYSDNNYYLDQDRWVRINPVTSEAIKVCEPIKGIVCRDGETPDVDDCMKPCEGVEAAVCDPVPSRQDPMEPYNFLNQANVPTSSLDWGSWIDPQENRIDYPVVYDNPPDCEEGQNNEGETYLVCDEVSTCPEDQQIDYCRPQARCEEGQSPISCSSVEGYAATEETCQRITDQTIRMLNYYQLLSDYTDEELVDSLHNFVCDPQTGDPEAVHQIPEVKIDCLPTPECEGDQRPEYITREIQLRCEYTTSDGVTHTWERDTQNDWSSTCDPIKSCE
ncbi:hypothetical protein GF354_04975 [Candidatus Peregrinibacteria bacterium]|nr:hypothetical protein [Candidatus Peregrinibacteria bacterium]